MVFKYVSIIVPFVFVAATLCGDSVRLDIADSGAAAETSFNSAGNWSNNEAPSSAHNYVVDLGSESGIILPSANATFNGASLQIGSAENSGRLDILTKDKTYTMTNLILKSGIFNVGANIKTTLNGKITVTSTLQEPFVIQGGTGTDITYQNNIFYGDSDSAIVIKGVGGVPNFHAPTWYQYNQSGYKGRWIVDNAIFMIASFASYAGEEFREDAIILRNNGILRGNASNPKFSHSKIGVTIEETGGKIQHGYSGRINIISIPFKGGPLTIERGVNSFSSKLTLSKFTVSTSNDDNGTVTFVAGAVHDIPEIVITSGELRYNNGVVYENTSPCPVKVQGGALRVDNFNYEKNYIILNGGTVYSSKSADTITNLVYNSGNIKVPFNTTENSPSCLTICGNITGISEENPVKITSSTWPAATTAAKSYRILAIPLSDLVVTSDMFDLSKVTFDDPLVELGKSIVVEDGIQYLEVHQRERAHITLLSGDTAFGSTTAFNGNPQQWSDGKVPSNGNVYDVALGVEPGQALKAPSSAATFAGTVLNIGSTANSGRIEFGASAKYTFPLMNFNNGMLIITNVANPTGKATNPTLSGSVVVKSTEDNPFEVRCNLGELTLASETLKSDNDAVLIFKGTANRHAFKVNSGSSWGNGGLNSYKGRIIIDNAAMVFGSMGYGRSSLLTNAVTLRNGGGVFSTAAGPNWNSNLGITVEDFGYISTVYGGTLSIRNPIAGGTLTFTSPTINIYSKTSLDKVIVSTGNSVTFISGAVCNNANYEIAKGPLTFNEGVVFTERDELPLITVSGTLNAGANAMGNLRLNLKNGGIFVAKNNGATIQAYRLTNASIEGGAAIKLDADPIAKSSDTLEIVGDEVAFTATPSNPLKLTLNVNTKLTPTTSRHAFDVMTLPSSIGRVMPNQFSLTVNNTYEGAADETADEQVRFKVRVYEKTDGRKVIRISNKSDGTKLMIQ